MRRKSWLSRHHSSKRKEFVSISKPVLSEQQRKLQLRKSRNCPIKGTVSETAHVQVINQKWSDVFKFVICETKWRQQAENNPHSHGGRRNNSGREQFFFKFRQRQEKGTGEVEMKNSARNKYLQVVVTGQIEVTYSSTRNSEFAMNLLSLENRRW